ncbi:MULTISPECIES: response regulator transcription factor [Sphingobacterium]|uniref:DNA-binding response regulator n=1 Tax=Sphingobacterium athyrii TaxID=2152717 RepID=A0A363NMY8_9SPHI|nr:MULTISPECIES: response regulator transcription factor [Sphingobacterium]PUV22060.1 DNA-binding response regulator [Sphingobacterium athyrii]QIH31799.1 response regulator transcription factor [Sphingobacterium sp. DR205]
MELLLIEDEPSVISLIERGLKEEGYNISIAMDGYTGLKMAGLNHYDLILLDVMLPGMNGLDVCKNIRMSNNEIPIIILTALNQTEDIVAAFERDADDYLTKPFRLEELKARINRYSRKSKTVSEQKNVLTFDDLQLDRDSKSVQRGNTPIILTATEFRLLEFLMLNRNKVLTRIDILEEVWGMDVDLSTNVVDVYVNYLRKKIDKQFARKLIHTVIGMGYVIRHEN